jgi:outer membrane protein assembly factor BamB
LPARRLHACGILISLLLALSGSAAEGPRTRKDPYEELYTGYEPDFVRKIAERSDHYGDFRGWQVPEKQMRLSTEPSFYTLNRVHQDARAEALVAAAQAKERDGRYRDALKMYQIVIDRFPQALYRVSKFGVFVPVAQYCQRRILRFPPNALGYYRTLHDPTAAQAFEQARRKHSLIGLSDIVDHMLATSYGGRALVTLGDASLDSGHHLAALEYYSTLREFFPPPELRTPELDLKVRYCRTMLGMKPAAETGPDAKSVLSEAQLARFRDVVGRATPETAPFHSQRASPPHTGADDYTLHPPTADPLSLTPAVWTRPLPGSRGDFFVYSQPVVTDNSVIFRHKNIVHCHSILNGERRWKNDLGGRAEWQNWHGRRFPLETVVVHDGLVFTSMYKGGASLVALDEVTGQLQWAYGRMAAATVEQARMRFEAAPAGGPRTIYAVYVLDNIEGDTHIDTEYGVMAFESTTGRLRWRKPLCRLTPGKFAAGFARRIRNRVRSYVSPPLYHQGTVYVNTNAGAVAALDARSGRIKWLMRYPYYHEIHDATRAFGGFRRYTHRLMNDVILWYPQRPLVVGDRLYVLPVDTKMILCLDRRSGKVLWTRVKGAYRNDRGSMIGGSAAYFLGSISTGELAVAYSTRKHAVHLLDPETGKPVWRSGDPVAPIGHPSMHYYFYFGSGRSIGARADTWNYQLAARPFLSSDDTLYVTSFHYWAYPVYGWAANLCRVSLADRKIVDRRRYLSGELIARARHDIGYAAELLKELQELPHKSGKVKDRIRAYQAMSADTVPANRHGPFLPHARVTFDRYGERFELRISARQVKMVYDRRAVAKALDGMAGPRADFARAELAFADARHRRAADLLRQCLANISSEDLDFRAVINQQLYQVHQRLARSAIRARDRETEFRECLGLSRTASTLAEEIETLFALAGACERRDDPAAAARLLQSIISTYGHHELPVPRVSVLGAAPVLAAADRIMNEAGEFVVGTFYRSELARSVELLRRGLPLYASTLSPLPDDFTLRAGDLAAMRLGALRERSEAFRKRFDARAARELKAAEIEERGHRLLEFAGSPAAQDVLGGLFERAAEHGGVAGRRRMWSLADAARVGGLDVPEAFGPKVRAPSGSPAPAPLVTPFEERRHTFEDAEGAARLVLERRGNRARHPGLLFLGARVRKRLDNKFNLTCLGLTDGKVRWEVRDIRLKGRGQEPGFFEAFVRGDRVVTHGLYDVLAYDVGTGKLAWRYRVPFDFEIKHALLSGDLLVLAGKSETIALYVPAESPNGEVVWRAEEQGDTYVAPYFVGPSPDADARATAGPTGSCCCGRCRST